MKKRSKTVYIVSVLALVTVLSIGYALLSGTLNINGSAKVKATSWDIYFDNLNVTTGSVTENEDTKIDQNDKTKVTFNVDLASPGDFYEFTVDIKNDGNIDAMIESYTITPELTTDQQKYLSYEVKYVNGAVVGVNDILEKNSTRTIKVRIEYLTSVSSTDLNSNDETLSLAFEVKYIQATSEAHEPVGPIRWISAVTGDGTNIGDDLAIGDEHFYVVSNDGDKAVLLSKYNLLVGNICTAMEGTTCTPLTNPTGIQDETSKGFHYAEGTTTFEFPSIGAVPFNSSAYWGNVTSSTYVYNDNASIKTYVDNYKDYLESLGAEIEEARLIKYEELESLGCDPLSTGYWGTCSGAPSWVTLTSYWTGAAVDNSLLWHVLVSGRMSYTEHDYNSGYGVRPIIVISSDAI